MRAARIGVLPFAALLVLILAPIAFAGWVGQNPPDWVPTPLVTFAFDVRLATAPLAKKAISLSRGSPLDKRVYRSRSGEDARFASGNVEIVGSLYRPGEGEGAMPGVLLLHGSTPEGRRMGLYRIMAEALAERGYVVLAIDQRGFGESAPAADPRRGDAFDYVGDAVRALAYLAAQPGVDSMRLSVIGHSFGVGIALTAGLSEPRTQGIVIISPGAPGPAPPAGTDAQARAEDVAHAEAHVDSEVDAEAETRAGPPPEDPDLDAPRGSRSRNYMARRAFRYGSTVWVPGVHYIGQPVPLEGHAAGDLADPGAKPLLIVTDAFEAAETIAALEAWEQTLRGPSRLLVAPRADHYLNTAGWGPIVVYDVRAVAGLIGEIDGWLGGSGAGCAVRGGCVWPGVQVVVLLVWLVAGVVVVLVVSVVLRRRSARRAA
jgi:pimeloyl-ACP methyl ester carboxylesterase